jgi:hypothetical protein
MLKKIISKFENLCFVIEVPIWTTQGILSKVGLTTMVDGQDSVMEA